MAKEEARTPKGHLFWATCDDQSGDSKVRGEMTCSRLISNEEMGFIKVGGKRAKMGERGEK